MASDKAPMPYGTGGTKGGKSRSGASPRPSGGARPSVNRSTSPYGTSSRGESRQLRGDEPNTSGRASQGKPATFPEPSGCVHGGTDGSCDELPSGPLEPYGNARKPVR